MFTIYIGVYFRIPIFTREQKGVVVYHVSCGLLRDADGDETLGVAVGSGENWHM